MMMMMKMKTMMMMKEIMRIISINPTYTNKEKIYKTISELAKFEGVDLNCHFSSYTLLSYACEVNEFNLFDFLLKSKLKMNSDNE